MVEPVRVRQRRRPEDAEREILSAAQDLLAEGREANLTVGDLMAHTGLGRSSFYMYFRDIPDLLRRLLWTIAGDLFAVSAAFEPSDDPAADCHRLCAGIVNVHVRHGPVLRAVSRSLAQADGGEDYYRECAVEHFVGAATAWIDGEVARGRVPAPLPAGVVRALVLMSDVYLADTLGRMPAEDPELVTSTLAFVWWRTLYGSGPGGDTVPGGPGAPSLPRPRRQAPGEGTP